MTIETCILRNKIDGFKIKRYTKTDALVDEDQPAKGYIKTSSITDISCMKMDFISTNIKDTSITQTEYLLDVLYDVNITPILESDIVVDASSKEREILLVKEYRVGNVIRMYTLYVR